MNKVTIEDTERYKVVSHGNGLAYECTDKISGKSVLLQGDDAAAWRERYDAAEEDHADAGWCLQSWDERLRELIHDYLPEY